MEKERAKMTKFVLVIKKIIANWDLRPWFKILKEKRIRNIKPKRDHIFAGMTFLLRIDF